MLAHKAAFSGTLMVAARLISRVIDLFTMLILARLLSPVDFGLVAIAMTVVLILESALELPLSQALVRLPEIKESYYDTAFTLGLLRGALLCIAVCVIAVPFASFYHHPALVPLIQVLSIAPAARGLLNPKLARFAKELNFKYEFRFELIGKLAAFAVGVIAALITHSYWSIALGTVAAPVVIALQSYILFPFRPKLTLKDWRIFSDFLGWISLSQIVLAINWQSDQLLLGKIMRPAQLGLFSTANNVTNIPMAALFSPILRPLLSAFTVARESPERLRSSYQSAAAAVVTIGLPLLVGQSFVAGPTVRLLLGSKWLGAIPFVHWLALSLLPMMFGILVTPLGMALNETKQLAWRNIFQMCIKLPLVIAGALMFGFAGVIGARLIAEAVTAVYCMLVVRRIIGASLTSQIMYCHRGILSVLAMAAVLAAVTPWLDWGDSVWMQAAQLGVTATLGAASYAGCLLALWSFEGRPHGIEAIGLRMLGTAWRKLLRVPAPAQTV
jgi:PST family polysaccharide transporter